MVDDADVNGGWGLSLMLGAGVDVVDVDDAASKNVSDKGCIVGAHIAHLSCHRRR